MRTCARTHTHTHTQTHVHTYTYANTNTHTRIYTHTHTHTTAVGRRGVSSKPNGAEATCAGGGVRRGFEEGGEGEKAARAAGTGLKGRQDISPVERVALGLYLCV